ncbi:MAG: cation:proton antiporter [Bacteroidetes bacterium]|nr:cation:proton antiporter [Bacteroidota bacterium]
MTIAHVIIFLGLLIFLSHFFNSLFSKTRIPNVLLLLLIGIIIGPIAGLVDKSFMGQFGTVFTTVTLIIILFESGTGLKFADIGKAIGSATMLTLWNFISTVIIAALIANVFGGLNWLSSVFVGAIIGGTSSAVVIPMVNQLKLNDKPKTVLFLESAISDVLCLVVGLAVLEGMKAGALSIGGVFSKMGMSFLFALLIGVAAGFIWSIILKLVRGIKNSMFTNFAFVFILYGVVELLNLNGGIAALAFGVILGNAEFINNSKWYQKVFLFKTTSLNANEKDFFGEIVFLVQTYFFVYVGVCIQFGNFWSYLIGLIIVGIIVLIRPFGIRVFAAKKAEPRDLAIMSIMTPKGLVPAVLASLPLQYGLKGGETIQDMGYSIVLFSILICSILVILVSKDPLIMSRFIGRKKGKQEKPTNELSYENAENEEVVIQPDQADDLSPKDD